MASTTPSTEDQLQMWKVIAAKLAYLLTKRDLPEATEPQIEKAAAGLLDFAVQRETGAPEVCICATNDGSVVCTASAGNHVGGDDNPLNKA